MNFYYGAEARADGHLDPDPREPRHRVHRPVGLRQEHVPADAEPDERHHSGHARRGHGAHRRRRHLRAARRRRRPAAPRRDGVPEVEPVPEVDLRERRLRPAHQRHGSERGRAARARRGEPARGGDLGRGQGPPARVGAGAVGRPAAAAVHRARAGGRAGGAADGRAGLGARSDRDAAHRGADLPAQEDTTRSSSSRTTCSRRRASRTSPRSSGWDAGRVRPDREDLHRAGRKAD